MSSAPESPAAPDREPVKQTVSFHRSYRRMAVGRRDIVRAAVTLAALIVFLIFKLETAPELFGRLSAWLRPHLPLEAGGGPLVEFSFLGRWTWLRLDLHLLSPSAKSLWLTLGISLPVFLLAAKTRLPQPVVIPARLLALVFFLFALLFVLVPGAFKYDPAFVIDFFLEASLLCWLLLPAIFWLVLIPLPSSLPVKLLAMTLLEAALTGLLAVKYAFFAFLCAKTNYLMMPLIIFFLCYLVDVMYLVCLFSILVDRTSRRLRRDVRVWQWA